MRARTVALVVAVSAPALAGCGATAAREAKVTRAPARASAVSPIAVSSAPGTCADVVNQTLHAVAARIDARAALHGGGGSGSRKLVAALTGPVPGACGATTARTVANTVGAVGERLVATENSGPAVALALDRVAHYPAFESAVRRRDATALRAAIVHFFRIRSLHIVRVRATTANGHLVGDVGGPYVLAPASRTIRDASGAVLGRVTLSIQDDTGYIKLMRRFAGAGVVLRTAAGVVPGSTAAPASIPANGTITGANGARFATFAFNTRAFPGGRLGVTLLVPLPETG